MALRTNALMNHFTSLAASTGLFDAVAGHEPKTAPGKGLTCAVVVADIRMAPSSGLNVISAVVEYALRIHLAMLQEPQDSIDPEIVNAADRVLELIVADFTASGLLRCVDIFGGDGGDGLRAQLGYITIDNKHFRTVDIIAPCLINDAFTVGS